jgi:hypothetical protein
MESPTITVHVPADTCLRIIDGAGCAVRVLHGHIWVTVDGMPQDIVARPGERVVLERDSRALVSTFDDATVMVSVRCGLREVGFMLHHVDKSPVLTVTTPGAESIGDVARWIGYGGGLAHRPLLTAEPIA